MSAVTARRGLIWPETGKPLSWDDTRSWVLNHRDHRVCQVCSGAATEIDHIWPKYWGGSDHIDNLQAICSLCNRSKGNKVDFHAATSQQLGWALDALLERLGTTSSQWRQVLSEYQRRDAAGPIRYVGRQLWSELADEMESALTEGTPA